MDDGPPFVVTFADSIEMISADGGGVCARRRPPFDTATPFD